MAVRHRGLVAALPAWAMAAPSGLRWQLGAELVAWAWPAPSAYLRKVRPVAVGILVRMARPVVVGLMAVQSRDMVAASAAWAMVAHGALAADGGDLVARAQAAPSAHPGWALKDLQGYGFFGIGGSASGFGGGIGGLGLGGSRGALAAVGGPLVAWAQEAPSAQPRKARVGLHGSGVSALAVRRRGMVAISAACVLAASSGLWLQSGMPLVAWARRPSSMHLGGLGEL